MHVPPRSVKSADMAHRQFVCVSHVQGCQWPRDPCLQHSCGQLWCASTLHPRWCTLEWHGPKG